MKQCNNISHILILLFSGNFGYIYSHYDIHHYNMIYFIMEWLANWIFASYLVANKLVI